MSSQRDVKVKHGLDCSPKNDTRLLVLDWLPLNSLRKGKEPKVR